MLFGGLKFFAPLCTAAGRILFEDHLLLYQYCDRWAWVRAKFLFFRSFLGRDRGADDFGIDNSGAE